MNISWSGYITISGSVQAMGRNASVWNYASMFNRDSKHSQGTTPGMMTVMNMALAPKPTVGSTPVN